MKYLVILALLTLACSGEDTNPSKCRPLMTISDANPVQFWPINCETWNESNPPGVHHYCFCQPFECVDGIKTQFLDDSGINYLLKILNEEEEQIEEIEFTETVDPNSESESIVFDLSSFVNQEIPLIPGATAWTLGATPSVNLPSPALSSKRLAKTGLSLPAGTYRITYSATISPAIDAANAILEPLLFLDDADTGIESMPISNGTHTATVTLPDIVASMTFTFVSGDSGSGSVKINSLSFVPIGFKSIYSINLIPSEQEICDQQIKLKIVKTNPLPSFSTWEEQTGGGLVTGWEITDTPEIDIDGPAGAGVFKNITGYIAGSYKIHWKITVTNTGISVATIDFTKAGVSVVDPADVFAGNTSSGNLSGPGTFGGDFEFDLTDSPDKVLFNVANFAANTKHFTIDELTITLNPTPEVELYKSDCLDIRTSHSESLLIDYTNHSNFAGITYKNQTPDPSFSIRIPAVFFQDRFPQEGEDFQLSNNTVIALNSQVKKQKLLSTDRMPSYMHEKMILVLQHQFLYIDRQYWIKGSEEYSRTEKKNKRDSFDMYTCWLTNKDFVVRNIL